MNSKSDMLFHFAELLGYIRFSEAQEHLLQQKMSAEQYCQQALSRPQFLRVQLLYFKHLLVCYAQKKNLLTEAQGDFVYQKKIEEIKNNKTMFTLFTLETNYFRSDFFTKMLEEMHNANLFTIGEFITLASTILSIPRDCAQAVQKLRTTLAGERTTGENKIFQDYRLTCACGATLLIRVAAQNVPLQVYCQKCNKIVIDTLRRLVQSRETAEAQSFKKHLQAEGEKKKFAHFTVDKLLGSGSMGKVYLAMNDNSGEVVALKILHKPENPKMIEYFVREAQILEKLQHPNIVRLIEWSDFQSHPYLAMEYLSGSTLAECITTGRISQMQSIQVLLKVLEALSYAHQNNIIHRDIKPSNILITEQNVKVLDMGIAKFLEDSIGYTKTGQIMGTGYYIAPEQIRDSKHVDHRVDIYSLGATLYHSICGSPPFSEYSNNMMKVLWAKVNQKYQKLQDRTLHLPQELIAIVEKAMAHDPKERYETPQEMRQSLLAFYQKQIATRDS